MLNVPDYEFWFVAGSQFLYGEEQLKNVHEYTEDELKEPNHEAVALDAVIQISKKYGKKKTDANQEGE